MNIELSASRLFILASVVILLVVGICGITGNPIDHAFEWSLIGLASFALGHLPV